MIELGSLFLASLLASTIVPGGVEPYLYYLYQQNYAFISLLLVATIGNALGGIITFLIGGLLFSGTSKLNSYPRIARFFHLSDKRVVQLQKYGIPLLLFSWVPVIGDPLVLAAGYLRFRFWLSAIAILVGKFFAILSCCGASTFIKAFR